MKPERQFTAALIPFKHTARTNCAESLQQIAMLFSLLFVVFVLLLFFFLTSVDMIFSTERDLANTHVQLQSNYAGFSIDILK